jgi:hypothetical protein
MATYVNDLRLKEITTGDESGTWGTSTNTNLELIAEAFSYGTEVITTNADTHTTTIADGATDPGRSLYLKYTGTLDSACTITIGPNTVSKVWIIENGTSGSQDIILSQGSGANITIPAGDTKVVYSDGAGAGAAFFDAFASINVGALTGTSLDISGDIDVDGTTNLDVVDIDGAVDMASTLTVASSLMLGVTSTTLTGGSLTLPNSGIIGFHDAGGDARNTLQFVSGELKHGAAGGGLTTQTFFTSAAERLRIDSSGGLITKPAAGGHAVFNENGVDADFRVESDTLTHALFVDGASGYVGINDSSPSAQLDLNTSDGLMTILNSTHTNGGYVRFEKSGVVYGDLGNGAQIVSGGATTAFGINTRGTGDLLLATNNVTRASLQNGGAFTTTPAAGGHSVFNEGGVDADFRVESDSNTHALFLDGATNTVSFGSSNPQTAYSFIGAGGIYIGNGNQPAGDFMSIDAEGSSGNTSMTFYRYDSSAAQYQNRLSIAGETAETVFNDSGLDVDFRVESDSETHMLFVDASTNQVFIGASSGAFGAHLTIENNASYTIESFRTGTGNEGHIAFKNGNGAVGSIFTNASATAYNTSSDERLKENITDANDAGDKIDAIKVRQFDWKVDGAHQDYGMIAQELMTVAPEAVSAPENLDEMMGVDYSKLVPMLVKEIQSLRTRITALES